MSSPKVYTPTSSAQKTGSNSGFETSPLDVNLLYLLSCLRAVNFRHIAFIARSMENMPGNMAYKVLWHEAMPQSLNVYKRLKRLCEIGWILPWQSWDPDRILSTSPGRARARMSNAFYVLGRDGREWVQSNLHIKPIPHVEEELYQTNPLARWLTASTCALTFDLEGAKLLLPTDVWTDIDFMIRAPVSPDFFIHLKSPTAFYICDSPFAQKSNFIIQQVLDVLKCMSSDTKSVILTYTDTAFRNVFISMKNNLQDKRIKKVYVGDLESFKYTRGHCTVVNAHEDREKL